jgi:Domain of unknown function (DU1801)
MAVSDKAESVERYLADLPADRQQALSTVRQVVLDNLPEGYEETIEFGMITYAIPLSRYPNTYNGRPLGYVALASQKNYMSLYLMGVYATPGGEAEFRERYAETGKKLKMGKSCVRFGKVEDLPLDLIGATVASVSVDDYIDVYEASRRR